MAQARGYCSPIEFEVGLNSVHTEVSTGYVTGFLFLTTPGIQSEISVT